MRQVLLSSSFTWWFKGINNLLRVICAGLSDGRGYIRILEKDLVPEQLIVFPAKK